MAAPDLHAATAAAVLDPPGVADRPVAGGFFASGWPVLVLALITLILVRACIPIAGTSGLAAFDAAAATRNANQRALARLAGLRADATPAEVAAALNLGVVNFASGSAELPADARPLLERAASRLASMAPGTRFEVGGHTDNTGSVELNQRLSEQRARAVIAVLLAAGVPPDRLAMRGYGDTRPIANNATEQGRFGNRRIEFTPLP